METDKENLMKQIATNLRSVTQSNKGGVLLVNLERDYKLLLGKNIPFKTMGFDALTSMLNAMSDVVKVVRDPTGQLKVTAVADKSTAHIASLISRQRDTKRKPAHPQRFRPKGSFVMRSGFSSSRTPNYRPRQRRSPPPPRPSVSRKVAAVQRSPPKELMELRVKVETPPQKKPVFSSTYEVPPRFLRQTKEKAFFMEEPVLAQRPLLETPHGNSASARGDGAFAEQKRHPLIEKPTMPHFFHDGDTPRMQRNDLYETISMPRSPLEAKSSPPRPAIRAPVGPVQSQRSTPQRYSDTTRIDSRAKSPPKKPRSDKATVSKSSDSTSSLLPYPAPLTAKEQVAQYAASANIEPRYKTTVMGQKAKSYFCSLVLGEDKYTSYPSDKPTSEAAEEEVASRALEAILKREEERMKLLPETSISTPEEIVVLMSRIEEIIAEKPNGMWSTGLPKEYENKFQEKLPSCWLQLVQQKLFAFIEIVDGADIPKGAVILRMPKMSSSGTTSPTSTSSKNTGDGRLSPVEEYSANPPPPLELPEDDQWAVFVCMVASVNNIAVRLYDFEEEFEKMTKKMKLFYQKHHHSALPFHAGQKLYAAYDVDYEHNEGNWHRVEIETFDPNAEKVSCYFVDRGEYGEVEVANVRELDGSFKQLPLQAIQVRLHELEDYITIVKCNDLVKYLLGKTLIANIMDRNSTPITAQLYDTSGDEDLNISDEIREDIFSDALVSEFPEVGTMSIFRLTFVTPSGELYLRSSNPYLQLFDTEIERLTPKFEAAPSPSVLELSMEEVYAAKFPDDECWYRAMFVDISETSPGEVVVFFIDYGNTSTVPLSNLKRLSSICPFVAKMDNLACNCYLYRVPRRPDLEWTDEAITELCEMATDKEDLIVKVDEPSGVDNLTLAKVTLYKRNQECAIVNLNESLAAKEYLFRESSVDSGQTSPSSSTTPNLPGEGDLHYSRTPLSVHIPDVAVPASVIDEQLAKLQSTHITTPPPLGKVGTPDGSIDENISLYSLQIPNPEELFNVFIALAASPSNFVVQPLDSHEKLSELLEEMNQFYSAEDNICDMHACLLKVGNFYAVHHSDDMWYRAQLRQILDPEGTTVAVCFVDYGDFAIPQMSHLQPLWKKFKTLPCQAIKATLAGVKPKYTDWNTEDNLQFRELVEERSFASIVKSKRPCSEEDFGICVLELVLIDTSTLPDKDIYIHELLIQKNIAVAEK